MSLLDSMEAILVNGFYDNMGVLYDANKESVASGNILDWINQISPAIKQTIFQYTYYGMSHLGLMIIKIYLVIYIITKLPSYFYDILDAKVNDVGDDIMNSMQQANEQQGMKGI